MIIARINAGKLIPIAISQEERIFNREMFWGKIRRLDPRRLFRVLRRFDSYRDRPKRRTSCPRIPRLNRKK